MRWETDTPIVDVRNRMNGFDPSQINPVSGTPGVVKFMGVNGFRTTPYDLDRNNFGPRFGFAWKPFENHEERCPRRLTASSSRIRSTAGSPIRPHSASALRPRLPRPDNGITAPFFLRDGVPEVRATSPALDDSFGAVPLGRAVNTAITYYEQIVPPAIRSSSISACSTNCLRNR